MLIFNVRNQNISRIDNFSPAEKSENYLEALFNFKTDDWKDCTKTAIFENSKSKVIKDVILVNDKCLVPWEVLEEKAIIKVSVYGINLSEKITTDTAEFSLNSTVSGGSATTEPTPDVYQQIIAMLDDIAQNGVTDEQIERAVEKYLAENPIGGVDKAEVQRIVAEYVEAHKEELKGNSGKDGIDGKDGKDGADGKDGFSPSAKVEQISDGALITITDANGTTTATVKNGKDGKDGSGNGSATTTADILDGKSILCVGDSICEGVGTNGHPYAYWIQQWHPNAEIINLGVGGMTIAQKDATITNSMPVRIANNEFEAYSDVDIVVFEGGINDLMNNVKLGYIQKGYAPTKYKTFCQGMEYMFSYFKNLFPAARMIFISTHNVTSFDYNKGQAWWGAASEICAKWGIEFLDLFGLICTSKIDGLQLHPNDDVHEKYYAKYLNMALTSDTPLAGARTTNYYKQNVPMLLQFYSGKKQFSAGTAISTSDWRINMVRADLTTYVNVSSTVTYDYSDVDNANVGTYPIHVAYTEDGITLSTDVDVTIVEGGSITKVLDSISATKTKINFVVGDVVNTDDITVTASYSDGSTANVTSSASIDTSNANMTTAGEYNISISYTEGNVTKTTQIQISVIEESGGDIPDVPDTPDEITWDDTTTVTAAWKTNEGIFSDTTITEKYIQDAEYNVTCKLMVESDSATSGEMILRLGGPTINLGTITFGEVIDVNGTMSANTMWTLGNLQPNVYTTSGSGFPWTVHIKDFVITE